MHGQSARPLDMPGYFRVRGHDDDSFAPATCAAICGTVSLPSSLAAGHRDSSLNRIL
jgi:hypothetical protein